jgi:lipid II:glycine glycyltransferase (peptidoglycan interpeptide bridge formation enzyme)
MNISEINKNTFLQLIQDCDYNSVFSSKKWLDIHTDIAYFQVFENEKKSPSAIFYLRKYQQYIYSIIRNPLYTPYIEIIILNKQTNKVNYSSTRKKILKAISSHLRSQKITIISFALPSDFVDMQPFIWNNFKVIPNYTYKIDLSQDLSIISSSMSTERRNDLKRTIKDGIQIKLEQNMEIVLKLVEQSLERSNKNNYKTTLNKILFEFADHTNSFAFCAYKNSQPIAVAFCIYDQNNVFYLLGGYDSKEKHNTAGASCVFASIEYSKSLGVKYFDFEGSMVEKIEKYFRGFGGDIVPYYTINKAPFLAEVLLKYKYRNIF